MGRVVTETVPIVKAFLSVRLKSVGETRSWGHAFGDGDRVGFYVICTFFSFFSPLSLLYNYSRQIASSVGNGTFTPRWRRPIRFSSWILLRRHDMSTLSFCLFLSLDAFKQILLFTVSRQIFQQLCRRCVLLILYHVSRERLIYDTVKKNRF